MATLLVIDDDQSLRYSIQKSLTSPRLRVVEAATAPIALDWLTENEPDVVLLDLRLSESSGLDLLRIIKKMKPALPVIMFTAYSTTTTAIEATKFGAFDYLLKPVDLIQLQSTIQQALDSRLLVGTALISTDAPQLQEADVCLIGDSPAMQDIYKKIGRFAPTQSNILILGESGTGKELVARAMHYHSRRRQGPFVAINCAALSETILESELFGHEKGAFTGADKRRPGKFEHAHGGTIFLDEIADMLPATQAKVLRLLQDQRFERLGGNETIATDVRVIAATNKNLPAMMQQGLFRSDLYYRLNVFSIELPPLRDRKEDIPDLVKYFISCFKQEFGKAAVEINPALFAMLDGHDWPGNMRELQSAIKHALAHADGLVIGPSHLPAVFQQEIPRKGAVSARHPMTLAGLVDLYLHEERRPIYDSLIGQVERILIPAVLMHTRGRVQEACEWLGLSRNTLKAKMREHGISVEALVSSKIDEGDQNLIAPS